MKVRAPATSANLGAGFDIFGIALDKPKVIVEVSESSSGETSIDVTGTYGEKVPTSPLENTAGIVAEAMGYPVQITIHAEIPISSGLGSSAAPAAATALGINVLHNTGHSREDLVWIAAEGERVSAGIPHADNVAAALFGGFNIVHERRIVSIKPKNIGITAVSPFVKVNTKKARKILPLKIKMSDFVFNAGSAAFMTAGMLRSDPELIGLGMENHVIEELRSQLIPGYTDVKKAATAAGALGVTISGSGPTMIAVSKLNQRERIADAMKQAFREHGIDSIEYKTMIGTGAQVIQYPT